MSDSFGYNDQEIIFFLYALNLIVGWSKIFANIKDSYIKKNLMKLVIHDPILIEQGLLSVQMEHWVTNSPEHKK